MVRSKDLTFIRSHSSFGVPEGNNYIISTSYFNNFREDHSKPSHILVKTYMNIQWAWNSSSRKVMVWS